MVPLPRRHLRLVGSFFVIAVCSTSLQLSRVGNRQLTITLFDWTTVADDDPTDNTESKNNKPLFIFHVGIAKSATTTLQSDLASFTSALSADNYRFHGTHDFRSIEALRSKLPCRGAVMDSYEAIQKCRRQWHTFHNTTTTTTNVSDHPLFHPHIDSFAMSTLTDTNCFQQMQSAVQENRFQNESHTTAILENVDCFAKSQYELMVYAEQHQNVIYSNEDYSMRWMMKRIQENDWFRVGLQHALEPFQVHVIVSYRRYAPWLLSAKRQRDHEYLLDAHCQSWSATGTRDCYLPNWSTITTYMQKQQAYKFHFTNQVLEFYRGVMKWNTSILSYHGDVEENPPTTVTQRFVCNSLPDAPHACQAARTQSTETRHNVARYRILEPLILEAERQGLLNRTDFPNPAHLQRSILWRMQQSNVNLAEAWPYTCPPQQELERLLNETLQLEQSILPDIAATNEESLRLEFEQLVSYPPNFCDIDVESVLQHNFTTWAGLLEHFLG